MRAFPLLSAALIPLMLSGCVSKIVTAPYRKRQRDLCLDEAQTKQERRNCEDAYRRDD